MMQDAFWISMMLFNIAFCMPLVVIGGFSFMLIPQLIAFVPQIISHALNP